MSAKLRIAVADDEADPPALMLTTRPAMTRAIRSTRLVFETGMIGLPKGFRR